MYDKARLNEIKKTKTGTLNISEHPRTCRNTKKENKQTKTKTKQKTKTKTKTENKNNSNDKRNEIKLMGNSYPMQVVMSVLGLT